MGITAEKMLVETAFGLAQRGSVLSPLMPTRVATIHKDAPAVPALSLEDYRLVPTECVHVCTERESFHLSGLMVTQDMGDKIEAATRDLAADQDWHCLHQCRITSSHFQEVRFVRRVSSAESLAQRILKGTRQTAEMRSVGANMEFEAVKEYSRMRNVNLRASSSIRMPLGLEPHQIAWFLIRLPNHTSDWWRLSVRMTRIMWTATVYGCSMVLCHSAKATHTIGKCRASC